MVPSGESSAQSLMLSASVAGLLLLEGCGGSGESSGTTTTSASPIARCLSSTSGTGPRVMLPSGFTNNTGFNGSTCVDICAAPGSEATPSDKNAPFDWDFVVMDHFYTPQMCHAFTQAGGEHDPTITNVPGVTCGDRTGAPLLAIHGLWPDYLVDYATCCQGPAPLESTVSNWCGSETVVAMQSRWVDVAVQDGCDVCFTWNHEWQKHGSCFAATPEVYFQAGLALDSAAEDALKAVGSALQARAGSTFTVAELRALYGNATGNNATVNVICDPRSSALIDGEEIPYVSEFQSCWQRKPGITKGIPVTATDLEPYDCPESYNGSYAHPCGDTFAVIGSEVVTI